MHYLLRVLRNLRCVCVGLFIDAIDFLHAQVCLYTDCRSRDPQLDMVTHLVCQLLCRRGLLYRPRLPQRCLNLVPTFWSQSEGLRGATCNGSRTCIVNTPFDTATAGYAALDIAVAELW
jgi:hypothetical protein